MLTYDYDDHPVGVLKYDIGSDRLSLIDAPCPWSITAGASILLMAMEDGSLGFAHVYGSTLSVWSKADGVGLSKKTRTSCLNTTITSQGKI